MGQLYIGFYTAFGHMDDDIGLGYQAGVVSWESPTYGRLWLSVAHHPGDTVSCTQAEALVLAAEARLRLWPPRRTELLRQRIHAGAQLVTQTGERLERQQQAQRRVDKTTAQLCQQQAELAALSQRLLRFEQDNATNSEPIEAEFRLDAGFGTYENVALLIEMGYDLYTKPHSHKVVTYLKELVGDTTAWTRVGANAELVGWPMLHLKHCPYPLDVPLERFYTGKTLKHSALFHFGTQPVTEQLPGWFEQYNGRQTIEAGIKESKQVFSLHHLKVRSEPAISLQEAFVLFAANFIRWAAHWLADQAQPLENASPRAEARHQTPGAGGGACLGAGHPGFRW